MKPQITKKINPEGILKIIFTGTLTIKYQKELIDIFRSIDSSVDKIEIHLDKPKVIDLCFLQLLEAFHSEWRASKKLLKLVANFSEADEKLLGRTGFLKAFGQQDQNNNNTSIL